MGDLLAGVLRAHGGLESWQNVTALTVHLSLGGPFWAARGWPGVYARQTVTLDPHREHITFTPFTGAGRTSVLDVNPERVVIRAAGGALVGERYVPRASFPLPFDALATTWDAVQVAYFTSAALWNHLTEPFVLTHPGVEVHEIAPWHDEGRTWRRLAVTFPETIANHNGLQVFHYDDQLLQRRVDYSPYVLGSPPIAHYCHDHRTFGGFVFPTRRRVHLHDAAGIADRSITAITIDIDDVVVL